ncbi:hypothetical protein [Chryseobacterium lactis]|uniref:hypothetical protein n=1 Tax=Chryseobacterium lactis TaxID=1241981 RepID=UPI00162AC54F|nr:hypothetical protein [Chryseobacterium lactis]
MNDFNLILKKHNKQFSYIEIFLPWRYTFFSRLSFFPGLAGVVSGYFWIILQNFLSGVFFMLLGIATLFIAFMVDVGIIGIFLEKDGYIIDNKKAPFKSTSVILKRDNLISTEYINYNTEAIKFLIDQSQYRITQIEKWKDSINRIVSVIGSALLAFIVSYIMASELENSFKLKSNLFVFLISAIITLLWNKMIKNMYDSRIKKYKSFKEDMEKLFLQRLISEG